MNVDFKTALRRADATFESLGYPDDVDRRIRGRLNERRPTHETLTWIAAVAVMAVAGLLWIRTPSTRPPPEPLRVAEFVVVESTADVFVTDTSDGVRLERGTATLVDETTSSRLTLSAPVVITREPRGFRVDEGIVRFDVTPRSTPILVVVSHGELRALGARFTVTQSGGEGRVDVENGHIEFVETGRPAQPMTGGESYAWPRPVAEPPRPRRRSRKQVAAPTPDDRAKEIFVRLARLRADGRYDEAVSLLESGIREGLGSNVDERFSYELGAILTYRLRRYSRACAHWMAHEERFSGKRYGIEIRRARGRAGCGVEGDEP